MTHLTVYYIYFPLSYEIIFVLDTFALLHADVSGMESKKAMYLWILTVIC